MVLEDCHITTEQTENSEKKGRTQGTAPKRATCYAYKLPGYKFSAEDEKYYMFTPKSPPKSPLSKRGVERAKLYL